MGFLRDLRVAANRLAQEPIRPPREYELPPETLPAVAAGALYELTDLRLHAPQGDREYAIIACTNNTGDVITLIDSSNNQQPIHEGQYYRWERPPGCTWVAVRPTGAALAGKITLQVTLRDRRASQ